MSLNALFNNTNVGLSFKLNKLSVNYNEKYIDYI